MVFKEELEALSHLKLPHKHTKALFDHPSRSTVAFEPSKTYFLPSAHITLYFHTKLTGMLATSTRAVLPHLPKMARLSAPVEARSFMPRSLNRAHSLRLHSSYRAATRVPRGFRSYEARFSQRKGPLRTRQWASKLPQQSTPAHEEGARQDSERAGWVERIRAWLSERFPGYTLGWLLSLEFVIWRVKRDLKNVKAEVREQAQIGEDTHTELF